MKWSRSSWVRRLDIAENRFLEVLVSSFDLERAGEGVRLTVRFDGNTPTIWTREAKEVVREAIPRFKERARNYQRRLDAFLIEGKGDKYSFDDRTFPFRYASGGALPIVRMGDEEYYCLFYRDVFPVGWNIANGGCDTLEELVNPLFAVDRELREELIVLDLAKRRRYVFEDDAGRRFDHPDFELARRIWHANFPDINVPDFPELTIPLRWVQGPDELVVTHGTDARGPIRGCFININAEDFGIEVDRVGKLALDDDVTLLDGEVIDGGLLNRVIGLFRTGRPDLVSCARGISYAPDLLFLSGQRHCGEKWREVIEEGYIGSLARSGKTDRALKWRRTRRKYGLCPVTRSILRRHVSRSIPHPPPKPASDVFITFAGEDVEFARRVYDYVCGHIKRSRVFFSDQAELGFFPEMIDEALESATCLVAVATKPQHLRKSWPAYEHRAFHMFIRNGRSSRRNLVRRIVPCVLDCDPSDLPLPLAGYDAVCCQSRRIQTGLGKLVERLRAHLRG